METYLLLSFSFNSFAFSYCIGDSAPLYGLSPSVKIDAVISLQCSGYPSRLFVVFIGVAR